MKKLLLIAALAFAPTAFAEVVDAGTDAGTSVALIGPTVMRADVVDAGEADAGDVDAGTADAGAGLVNGDDIDVVGMAKELNKPHPQSWKILFALVAAVTVLTALARKVGGQFIPFLKTDRGGALTVLLLGVAGGLVNAMVAGDGMSMNGLATGAYVTFLSAGGFAVVKKILFPSDATPAPAPTPAKPS